MKRKLFLIVSAMLLALSFSSANAATVSADYDLVSSISIGSTGILYIFMEEEEINPAFCADSGRYAMAADNPNYNIVYAQILTAMAAGYEVKFAIESDVNDCVSTYAKVSRAAMRTP